jgi:hypothetical protein
MKPSLTKKLVAMAANPIILAPVATIVVATATMHVNDLRVFWVNSWQELKGPKALACALPPELPTSAAEPPAPTQAKPKRLAVYYNFTSANGSKCHLVVVDGNSQRFVFEPYLFAKTGTTSAALNKTHALAATNGGYFTPPTDQSAGFVVLNEVLVADPRNNGEIARSRKVKPYLKQIFNRSELRVLQDDNLQLGYQIAAHNSALPANYHLLNSLQAGPCLLPKVTAYEEAFIRKDPDNGRVVDVIGTRENRPRTAFGITPDGHLLLLCVAGKEDQSGSPGMNLQAVADLLKMLGCVQAVNLDGGHSTTMVVDSCGGMSTGSTKSTCPHSVCSAYPQTQVKSVLLLVPYLPASKTDNDWPR